MTYISQRVFGNTLTLEKGEWRPVVVDRQRTAKLCCPECGRSGNLTEHTISRDGVVTPSVECTTSGCEFHEMVKLEGWSA